ncbi:MAG: L-threonylcarbamoyladenylate synthase [Saprospiraceae bacterium]
MTIVTSDIQQASEILKRNNLVAIPTETVYGLAGNIYSETAIRKIFALKQRPLFNPLIVHIHSIAQLDNLVRYVPPKAKLLAERFWPGSLTLILPKQDSIPDLITAGKDTVGVRMPNHPLTLQLLKTLDFPLAAPSANPFTAISPTRPEHVKNYFNGKLKMVLDGGNCQNGIESTIVGFEVDTPVLYRLGSIAVEAIEEVVGSIEIKNKKEVAPNAPGMLERHYAPTTRTYLVDDVADFIRNFSDKKIGVLVFNQPPNISNIAALKILSPSGNLAEAAAKLYATLHELDKLDLDIIVAERFPNRGVGKSINDRLERATK